MEEERSQPTPQKYKRLLENTMKNYMPTNWTIWKKWTNSQTSHTTKTQMGRNRKFEQTQRNLSIIKNSPTNKSSEPYGFPGNSTRRLKQS